jgi:acetyl esterase/lipase
MLKLASLLLLCLCTAGVSAAQEHKYELLWPDGAPGAQGSEEADQPRLFLYPAPVKNRVPTAIVVCPGGGYTHLSMKSEGSEVAEWFNSKGISAFVLQYRLGPKYQHPVELGDAQRAIRYVRAHAAEYGARPDRIGIIGFSAGGHLASSTATHFDRGNPQASDPLEKQSSRPDFAVLAYPVITMQDPYAHVGSRNALLGQRPNPDLVLAMSSELQVTTQTPPTFLFHTTEDQVVPVENSILFYSAMRRAGVPGELHVYLKGRHGVGLATQDPILRSWTERLSDWLQAQGLLPVSARDAR